MKLVTTTVNLSVMDDTEVF